MQHCTGYVREPVTGMIDFIGIVFSLVGFTTAPGDPAAYSYDRDGARGALAIHVDNALTCGNDLFYDTVIVPLLSQFSISKLEQSSFKFMVMHVKKSADFAVSLR